MIGSLARKRTNVVAVAALLALVAAMFVGLQSASAAVAFGACSSDANTKNYLTVGDTCTINAIALSSEVKYSPSGVVEYSTDVDPSPDNTQAGFLATSAGSVKVTIVTADTSDTDPVYNFVVAAAPSIELSVNDSDNLVKAGTKVWVTVTGTGIGDDTDSNKIAPSVPVTLSVPSTGLYFVHGQSSGTSTTPLTTVQTVSVTLGDSGSTSALATKSQVKSFGQVETRNQDGITGRLEYLSTVGAAAGEYKITASWEAVGNIKAGSDTLTLTIGDPGKGLSGASIALDKDQKSTVKVGTAVGLVLSSTNEQGKAANAGDVDQVLVYASNADIVIASAPTGSTGNSTHYASADDSATTDWNASGGADDDLGASVKFTVTGTEAGTVDVTATVLGGAAGNANAAAFTLTFVGDPDAISVGDASGHVAQHGGKATFAVTATDKKGNAASLTRNNIQVKIKDADDKDAKNLTATRTQNFTDTNGNGTQDAGEKDDPTTVIITVTSPDTQDADATTKQMVAAAGAYSVEVTLNNKADTKQTSALTVVGPADSIAVSVDNSEAAIGDVITVTATVTDADGNPVTKGTVVTFKNAGALKLDAFSTETPHATAKTDASGMASMQYIVTDGSGAAVILAQTGGKTGNTSVSTMTAEPADAEPEEVGLDCLSETSGFSVFTCGSSTASELFTLLSSRGATAIHLNTGSGWVRYSTVGGELVPGSSDFAVIEDDILYISN